MKRLFILWSLLISFVHGVEINEDITDIYFGNGVWNDSETAKNGRDELSRKILWSVYNGNIQTFKKRHYAVRDSAEANENIILLSYNWTGVSPETGAGNIDEYFGFFWDIVEIFDQLQREGQLPYFSFFGWLQHSEHSIIREWLDNYFISIDGANLEDMLNRYKTISFTKGHRVLLVSHSQGGKFANRVYDTLTPTWYKDYFANLQVASPASSVHALKGAYVTFRGDKLINSIPGSMEGNADLNPEDDVLFDLNHEFVSEYLRQTDSLRQILENIPALLLALDRTYSQWLIKTENINTHICEERRAELIHFQESLTIPTAFPFRIDSVDVNGTKRYLGKAYPLDVNGIKKYVFASEDGELIIDVEDQNIILDDMSNDVGCYLLDGTEDQIVKGCGDANVTEGVLEVDLSWKSPAIDLELTVFKEGEDGAGDVEIVSYDTFDETCPKEHWFIENEADVQAGTYVVHITTQDTTNIDEALLPETIKLKIDAPGGGLKISINIPSTDLLNIGAVAKIIITKPEGGIRVAVEVTEHPDLEYAGERYQYDKDGKVYNYEVVSLLNRIELGPIANAQIEIMSLVATDFGQIVYNGYTSSGDTLDTNGLMLLPSSFKQSVASDGLYLISATGGEDVDTDDDLNMDATPTSNFGSIHAIVSGAAIKENGLKVNILTEL
uniref:hypothetical protein n=1 Tax=Sulfurovum sp. TaxID=1969726 RepID=UPI00356237EB